MSKKHDHSHDHSHEHPGGLTCEQVMEYLFAHLDRELDEGLHANMEHHLKACRSCFSRAEFETALKARVRKLGQSESPESLKRRIKTLIDNF